MSADWYFLKTGFFGGSRKVGPISESDLRDKIEHGVVQPETMLSSTTKTHGRWCRMKEIRVAMSVWDKSHPSSTS
jgi:hypothetical protein